ncbi:Tex-like N-terminal domain-containing protein [Blautia sp. OF03-13]|uniref:Tex-like N-terminal domain-containing protein n=1 Tax=Blautia sp. OF03-13 TaxID=2292980 RepID=UPI0026AF9CB7|nr:Tex-like N-terminal domain-containing protein [Blautia sp. OF03-13]
MDINQRLTEELKKQILAEETLVAVEDLYRPYRPKRRTRATIAKERAAGCIGSHCRRQRNRLRRQRKLISLKKKEIVAEKKNKKTDTDDYLLTLEQKKFQNKSKNIDEVYQSESFRCIMSLSYRVTFLWNVLEQTHYTSESPVRYFFMKKL